MFVSVSNVCSCFLHSYFFVPCVFLSLIFVINSHSAPVVSHVDRVNAAMSSGFSLTFSGTEFGSLNETPSLFIAGLVCMTTRWVSTSSMLCLSPANVDPTHTFAPHIHSIVSLLSGTLTGYFSFDGSLKLIVCLYKT